MNKAKKIFALLLCLCMVLSYVPASALAADGATNVSMTVDKTQVEVGDTVTVTLSHYEMTVSSFTCGVSFDTEKLECVSIVGPDAEYPEDFYLTKTSGRNPYVNATAVSTVSEANGNGNVGFALAATANASYIEEIVYTVTFRAKADGEAVFTLYEDSAGTDGYKNKNVETKTVTISSEPACDHEGKTYTYAPNNNGTHTVTCECGEVVNADESCSGGTATCTEGAKCSACDYEYKAKLGHTEDTRKETVGEADCETPATFCDIVYCTECGETLRTGNPYTEGTALGHDWGTVTYSWNSDYTACTAKRVCKVETCKHEETAEATVTSAVTPATCKDVETTVYTATFTADWATTQVTDPIETGVVNHDNHASTEITYVDTTADTHTVKHTCCGAEETPADHDFNNDAHTCVCGKVEEFTLTFVAMQFSGDEAVSNFGVEVSVPYGALLSAYIPTDGGEAWENAPVYKQGDKVTVNGKYNEGTYTVGAWTDEAQNEVNLEEATMPAADMRLYQDWSFTGWEHVYHDPDTGAWTETRLGTCYVINDTPQLGWTEIDDNWYYFSEQTYFRAEGLTRVPYPTVEINGNTYAPDAEAKAYCASKGETFIDETEAWFDFDKDGKFDYEGNGYISRGDNQGKLVNGMLAWHPGLIEVDDGVYVYFIGDVVNGGNIGANGDTYITKNNGIEAFKIGDVYNFANGKLSGANGIVDGKYYENSRLMLGYGLVETENGFIYVRSNGDLATGKYYISNLANYDGEELNYGDGVTFGADGYAINGIVDGKYYVNGKVAYNAGVVEIEDGKYIYVRSNGQIVKDQNYWITNVGDSGLVAKTYTFDANGIIQNPEFVKDAKNGIVDGYYYVSGNIAYGAGLIEYNGGYIYVRSNGMVATGKYWVTNTNNLMEAGYYTFGEDGMMIK